MDIYKSLRKIFFWFFFFSFVVLLPLVILYSLGYQFDRNLKKFHRTGVISIKSIPSGAEVYLEGKRLTRLTPCEIRELLPAKYKIRLEKEGFYPYETDIEVKGSLVSLVEPVLIPKIKDLEKIRLDLTIYKFFVLEHLFGKKIIVLAKEGIYIFNEDFEEIAEISPINLSAEILSTIKNLREGRNHIIFWNSDDIWLVDYGGGITKRDYSLQHLYKTEGKIREVFLGFKDRYLIIQEEDRVFVLDIRNTKSLFELYKLNTKEAEIYYDNSSDTLFIKDKPLNSNKFSLFKINVVKKIYEKSQD